MKTLKKLLCCMLTAILVVSSASAVFAATNSPTQAPQPQRLSTQGTTVGGISNCKVDTSTSGNAAVTNMHSNSKTQINVSSSVKVRGVKYTVTRIKADAFKKCKKTKKVVLPSTLKQIDSRAFTGASKLKTVTLKSSKSPKVSKGAFKGLDTKKMTIEVNKKISASEYKKLVKAMRAAGFKGTIKKVKV